MRLRAILIYPVMIAASPAVAQLLNENLLVRVPDGYKVDHQAKNEKQIINEMVPSGESVATWTEMVTVQISSAPRSRSSRCRTRSRKAG